MREKNIICVTTEVVSLKRTVAEMNVKIGMLEQELKALKIPSIEVNIVPSKDFKCEQCGYMCKTEVTLRKHMNTKHQFDHEEVNVVIQNDSDKKELTKTKDQIKELEERVEKFTLSKSKVECEVGKLRAESDSLASLLSLRQSIDNPVQVKQTQKKTKNITCCPLVVG